MNEARRLGRGLSFLLEKSTEEKRKDNLKKYFLDPNCIESLQDEIIRLKKELKGIQVNTKTEYNITPKKDKRFDDSKIKDELLYTIKEASKLTHIGCRTIHRRCVQNSLKKTHNRYLITGIMLKEWIDISLLKTEKYNNEREQKKRLYSVSQAAKKLGLSKRAVQIRCKKDNIMKKDNKYLITDLLLDKMAFPPSDEIEYYSDSFFESSIITDNNTKTYLIKNRRNGFYKIGRSKDPLKREQTLQSEEPDIVMVKTWDEDIESKLHIEYKDYRIRGEWFELSKAQVKYICTNYERS
tara:strand:+ start:43 stop:930 length:888 start_codon:yes stop_codon:yes gene_type:complete